MRMNKRGGEKLLSIWWFAVIAIVGAAVVGVVWMYYSAEIDVRGIEADILVNKIARCLNYDGYVDGNFFRADYDLASCGLDKNVFDSNGDFYVRVAISDGSNKLEEKYLGNRAFEKDCVISDKLMAKKYPKCIIKKEISFYYDRKETKQVNLEILAGFNQVGRINVG